MWGKIKGTGAAIGIVVIPVLMLSLLLIGSLIGVFFIEGGAWLGEKIHPWLVEATSITLVVVIVILLPLVLFRRTRGFSGGGLMIASAVFGFTLWVWGLLLTYRLWGVIAVFIGIAFMGIGVVPMAMLATLFKGMWSTFGELVLLAMLTFGTGFGGMWAAAKAEEY